MRAFMPQRRDFASARYHTQLGCNDEPDARNILTIASFSAAAYECVGEMGELGVVMFSDVCWMARRSLFNSDLS